MARRPRVVPVARRAKVPVAVSVVVPIRRPVVEHWQMDPVEAVPPVAGLVQETFSLAYRDHTLRFFRGARCEPDPSLVAFLQSQNCPILWEANDVTER